MDLHDVKMITLSQGVPGDHLDAPGLTAGLIPYQNSGGGDDVEFGDADSENSESDSLSLKESQLDGATGDLEDDDGSGMEFQLRPTIIRCAGALSQKEGAMATAHCDLFDVEEMEWRRIEPAMHCERVHTQSVVINGKLLVIGGEVVSKESSQSTAELRQSHTHVHRHSQTEKAETIQK